MARKPPGIIRYNITAGNIQRAAARKLHVPDASFLIRNGLGNVDFDVSAVSDNETRTITMPDEDVNLGGFEPSSTQEFAGLTITDLLVAEEDSVQVQIVSGTAGINEAPASLTFYANYASGLDADLYGGVATGTAYGGAAVAAGKLDLAHTDVRYVTYDADLNADSQQVGCIRFYVTPNYSGTPSGNRNFVVVHKAEGDADNLILIRHTTAGNMALYIYDSSGTPIMSVDLAAWSPTAAQEYEIELNWDVTTGATRLFIDGTQLGSTQTATGTRDANIAIFRLGTNVGKTDESNFALDNVTVFSAVQHTTDYVSTKISYQDPVPGLCFIDDPLTGWLYYADDPDINGSGSAFEYCVKEGTSSTKVLAMNLTNIQVINGCNFYVESGDVGIGVASPSERLEVDGNIKCDKITISDAPTTGTHGANKDYVDQYLQGLEWQDSVTSQVNFVTSEPGSPSTGDRYINTATGTSSGTSQVVTANYIYEWNGTDWTETVVTEGFACWDETLDNTYVFNGSAWVKFASTLTHANLAGLQGGTSSEYYHLTATEHPYVSGANSQSLLTTAAPTFTDVTLTGMTGSIITTAGAETSIEELDASQAAEFNTGIEAWGGAGNYYSVTDTNTFNVLRAGTGFVKGKAVSWAGSQSVVVAINTTAFVYIDSNGTIGSTTTDSDSLFQNYIVLFEALYDGTNVLVVREDHPYYFQVQPSRYLHENVGVVIQSVGANITRVATGTGAAAEDREIKIVGADVLVDHGLETTIPDSAGAGVTWNTYYINGSGKWVRDTQQTELTMKYNNSGTPTALANGEYGFYVAMISKDDLNSSTPVYFMIMQDAIYANLAAIQAAISTGNVILPTNELANLELAQLGYVAVLQNVSGGYIPALLVVKSSFNSTFLGGSSATGDHGLLTGLTDDDHTQYLLTDGTRSATAINLSGDASLDGAVVINESGADKDFRVEGSGVANALFVQGSDGFVGISTNTPGRKLHIQDSGGTLNAFLERTDLSNDAYATFEIGSSEATGRVGLFGYLYKTTAADSSAFISMYGDNPAAGVGLFVQSGGIVSVGSNTPMTDTNFNVAASGDVAITLQRTGGSEYDSAILATGGALTFKGGSDSATVAGLTEYFRVGSTGILSTGAEASPDASPGGLTLQQNAEDGKILTFKSSDGGHGLTSIAETDTYAYYVKLFGAGGGLQTVAITDGDETVSIAYQIVAYLRDTADTTSSTAGRGVNEIKVFQHDGANSTSAVADAGNIFVLRNNDVTKQIFKGDGGFSSMGGKWATGAEAAPDCSAGGLTLQQNTASSAILTFKSTDVAHGRTTIAETDTFGTIGQSILEHGGLAITGIDDYTSSSSIPLTLAGHGRGTANTGSDQDGYGLVLFAVQQHDGADTGSVVADAGNAFSFYNYDRTVGLIKGNGTTIHLGDEPNLILHNTTASDAATGRISQIIFRGEQSGGEISDLSYIDARHTGTGDDEKAQFSIYVNYGGASSSILSARLGNAEEIVINNGSRDYDFRVESDGDANALFLDGGTGKIGFGTATPSAYADLTLEGGALCIKEITTPTADANYGKIYTKTDNKIYFQDGAGAEHTIAFV